MAPHPLMAQDPPHAPVPVRRDGASMKRVLLFDGDVHVLHVLKSSLDRNGYEVDTALSATVARALYDEIRHDVVLVDGDVAGAATLIEGIVRDRDPVLVLVCGEAAPVENGFERLDKPLSLRYLVGRLAEHFGHFRTVGATARG